MYCSRHDVPKLENTGDIPSGEDATDIVEVTHK